MASIDSLHSPCSHIHKVIMQTKCLQELEASFKDIMTEIKNIQTWRLESNLPNAY